MPIKGVKLCGAKCRTKGGAPCEQPGMKNGRCKMHGGVFYRRETHGCSTPDSQGRAQAGARPTERNASAESGDGDSSR